MEELNYEETSRPYTKEEIREAFLKNLYNMINIYREHDRKSLVFYFLNTIDNGMPSFQLVESTANEDIAGYLHEYLFKTDEELFSSLKEGHISYTQLNFLNRLRELAYEYDDSLNHDCHQLMIQILNIIDNGMNNVKFEMKAIGYEEDIEESIEEGDNYYPLDGENIAGELSTMYNQIIEKYEKYNEENKTGIRL